MLQNWHETKVCELTFFFWCVLFQSKSLVAGCLRWFWNIRVQSSPGHPHQTTRWKKGIWWSMWCSWVRRNQGPKRKLWRSQLAGWHNQQIAEKSTILEYSRCVLDPNWKFCHCQTRTRDSWRHVLDTIWDSKISKAYILCFYMAQNESLSLNGWSLVIWTALRGAEETAWAPAGDHWLHTSHSGAATVLPTVVPGFHSQHRLVCW